MNKFEWTALLDAYLVKSVVRNYFNFEVVCLEIDQEAKRAGLDFGTAHAFTNEKCRMRWSYLHV